MPNHTIRKLFGSAVLVLSLAACGDDPAGNDDSMRGSIAFDYSGAVSGQFDADGEYNRSGAIDQTFSAAMQDQDGLTLLGSVGQPNLRADVFVINLPPRLGTVTCRSVDEDCSMIAAFILGVSDADDRTDGLYAGYEGTVTISSLTEKRARGTFSLTLEDFEDFSGNAPAVEVRSGTFDVPIVNEDFGTGQNRAPARQLNRVRLLRAR